MSVPWETINEKLPFQRNKVDLINVIRSIFGFFVLITMKNCLRVGNTVYIVCRTTAVLPVYNIVQIQKRFKVDKSTQINNVQEAYAKRKEMWTAMDVNGNGYLSLAEVTKVTTVTTIAF